MPRPSPPVLSVGFALAVGLGLLANCGGRSELRVGKAPIAVDDEGVGGAGGQGGFGGDGGAGGQGGAGGAGGAYDCTEQEEPYIYLLTSSDQIWSYYPPTNAFGNVALLDCGEDVLPFSMAVDFRGVAHMITSPGDLYRVSTLDGSCVKTPYIAPDFGFRNFGSAFVADSDGDGESYYASDINYETSSTIGVGIVNVDTYKLEYVAPFDNPPGFRVELTGAGDQLFAFFLDPPTGGGTLAQVNKQTGALVDPTFLPIGANVSGWALAFWGDAFYFFMSPADTNVTNIIRYRPGTGAIEPIQQLSDRIVGAGVSTCAPATL